MRGVSPWICADLAPNGRSVCDNFRDWFAASHVIDGQGQPLPVHHGSGATIHAFNPAFTGMGNDQFGSGFYFTTDLDQAKGYETAKLPSIAGCEKLGGDSTPNTVSVFLRIQRPICLGICDESLSAVSVSARQAQAIIARAPHVLDPDSSPLVNWVDNGGQPFTAQQLKKVASGYSNLIAIENDFFTGCATQFRLAVHAATGFDGVQKSFSDGSQHFVAWFPEQIKSTQNCGLFLKGSASLCDAEAAVELRNAALAKEVVATDRSPAKRLIAS